MRLKKKGVVVIDSEGQKYICGTPDLQKPLTIKLSKKNLNWKLVMNPDLNFPEAYMRGEIKFENGSLLDFLNIPEHQLWLTCHLYELVKFFQLLNCSLPIIF